MPKRLKTGGNSATLTATRFYISEYMPMIKHFADHNGIELNRFAEALRPNRWLSTLSQAAWAFAPLTRLR